MQEPPLEILIQFAAKKTSQMAEERLAKAGLAKLHPPQGQILAFLYSRPNMSASDIQETLRISKSTVSEALSGLVSLGLIEYVTSEEDRREKRIVETEKGKRHQEEAWKVFKQCEQDIRQGLSDEEVEAFRRCLSTMIENTKGGDRG